MFMSGCRDRRANRYMSGTYWKSPADYKVFAAVSGGKHMEPFGPGRLNPYAAHFLACHVRHLQESCDKVYGNGEDSMCEKVATSTCWRSAKGPLAPNTTTVTTTTTTYTGTTTTTTITTVVGVSIRNVGSDICLKSNGKGKVLEETGDGSCAKFTIVGKAFKSADEPGACLDLFSRKRWGLWKCHPGANQQLVADGTGKWCSGIHHHGSHCAIVFYDGPTTTPNGTLTTTTSATTTTIAP